MIWPEGKATDKITRHIGVLHNYSFCSFFSVLKVKKKKGSFEKGFDR